jgi:sortase (surface protein transpeptidase)
MSARIVPVGLDAQGQQLEVPSPALVGWYRLGPAPGAVGPAVIVGHVDMLSGPAAFYRLTGVRTGEVILIVRADGTRSRFVVTRVTQVKKTAFPSTAVFGPTPTPTLRLITCTGPFNPHSHHYIDSLIVWAVAA